MPAPCDWYENQVVLLTGATGNLGGCFMHQLALKLPTSKIYVLCRGSMSRAMEKWESSMPEHIDEIMETGKIQILTGDITQPNLGLEPRELAMLQQEVTLVVHAAANFSFFQELSGAIRDNCAPVIELARMLLFFHKIQMFLYTSSIQSQAFRSDITLSETIAKISPNEEPCNAQLANILTTGQSPYSERFPTSYGLAKYLAEQLLVDLKAPFPILIVRPTSIGPAIRDPYPFYGPEESIPVYTFFQLVFQATDHRRLERFDAYNLDQVVDEIPVDLVVNTCLLHLAKGSNGVVHVGSQLYEPFTGGDFIRRIKQYVPPSLIEKVARVRVEKNAYFSNQVHDMYNRIRHDWRVDCGRSLGLKTTTGPIGLSIDSHQPEDYFRERIMHQARSVEAWIDNLDTPRIVGPRNV
ncbi:hypothetical protein PoHVEF18_008582 [Penicillium ochrochloron]